MTPVQQALPDGQPVAAGLVKVMVQQAPEDENEMSFRTPTGVVPEAESGRVQTEGIFAQHPGTHAGGGDEAVFQSWFHAEDEFAAGVYLSPRQADRALTHLERPKT